MLRHSEIGWAHTAVFELDTPELRKAVGAGRRIEEERGHWIDVIEDMDLDCDWDNSEGLNASVAEVSVSVTVSVTERNWSNWEHYWWGRRRWSVGHSYFLGMPWHRGQAHGMIRPYGVQNPLESQTR